ncbi:hypothetical protein CHS0354_008925 [Potamilus streckersoni]|uniref:Uncharacterized protein n=1 Tax=Potamilus streckersoni TaxID=2493646 RepID=A0AAE0VH18_9BIVA|nr:hypothetical protein CHS0354_008925 [Potamilus streckersoni]
MQTVVKYLSRNIVNQMEIYLKAQMKYTKPDDLLVSLYGGVPTEGLDLMRFRKFACKAMTSYTYVQIHKLPPATDVAKQHCMRAYFKTGQARLKLNHRYEDVP